MKKVFLLLCTVLCTAVGSAWAAYEMQQERANVAAPQAQELPTIVVTVHNQTNFPIKYTLCRASSPRASLAQCAGVLNLSELRTLAANTTSEPFTIHKNIDRRLSSYTKFFAVAKEEIEEGVGSTKPSKIEENSIASRVLPQHIGTHCTGNEVRITVTSSKRDHKKLNLNIKDNFNCSLSRATQSAKGVLRKAKESIQNKLRRRPPSFEGRELSGKEKAVKPESELETV